MHVNRNFKTCCTHEVQPCQSRFLPRLIQMRRATVTCSSNDASGSVVWFPGTTDLVIYRSLCNCVELDPYSEVMFTEKGSQTILAISEFLPDNLSLSATPAYGTSKRSLKPEVAAPSDHLAEETPLLFGEKKSQQAMMNSCPDFQGELLKFNRISSHLANERTYLAWARTSMSILSVGFNLKNETSRAFNFSTKWYCATALHYFSQGRVLNAYRSQQGLCLVCFKLCVPTRCEYRLVQRMGSIHSSKRGVSDNISD